MIVLSRNRLPQVEVVDSVSPPKSMRPYPVECALHELLLMLGRDTIVIFGELYVMQVHVRVHEQLSILVLRLYGAPIKGREPRSGGEIVRGESPVKHSEALGYEVLNRVYVTHHSVFQTRNLSLVHLLSFCLVSDMLVQLLVNGLLWLCEPEKEIRI